MRRSRLLVLLLLVAMALLTACGGGGKPAPPPSSQAHGAEARASLSPGTAAPNCAASATNHALGECLPKPTSRQRALSFAAPSLPVPAGTIRCVDLSNNDPVYGVGNWQIIKAHGFQCAIFKVNESNGFIDWTAARMTADAKAAGLFVGGYDFMHVCGPDEAQTFIDHLRADGLTGPGTLPGTADAEYPSSIGCNGAGWIGSWVSTVKGQLGRQPMVYTGNWWWGDLIGCWFPSGSDAWISGYTGSLSAVPRLCGHPGIDLWQYTDAASFGAGSGDASVWVDSTDAFAKLVQAGPTQSDFLHWRQARNASLTAYHKNLCEKPVMGRPLCGVFAWRVDHFQKLVDQQGKGPRCFGRGSNVHVTWPECQIVRPAVAVWSRASAASHKYHNVGVARYFDGRINKTLATSRL